MTLAFHPVDPVEDVLFRLAHFRRQAFGVRTDFEADLMEWFGFARRQARIVAALYAAGGPINREALSERAGVTAETLRYDLGSVRQALGDGAIPHATDGFYQLTQLGRAACDEAVASVGMDRARKLLGIEP